jgi:hypothetical protein
MIAKFINLPFLIDAMSLTHTDRTYPVVLIDFSTKDRRHHSTAYILALTCFRLVDGDGLWDVSI